MRFLLPHEPEYGDTRTRIFFALFPFRYGSEFRWLEMVTVIEEFVQGYIDAIDHWQIISINN